MEKRKVIVNLEIEIDFGKTNWSIAFKETFKRLYKELKKINKEPDKFYLVKGRSTTHQGFDGVSTYKHIIPLGQWPEKQE